MKQLLLTNLIFLLFTLSFVSLSAQDIAVCEETGYVVQTAGTSTACAGSQTGQATVSSTGCSCMFSGCTYEWSDGQTFHTAFNLSAGTYNVLVTHPPDSLGNICQVTVEVVIEDGEEMIESVDQTEISCPDSDDASITINPSVFAGQLNYQWSTGDTTATVNGLSSGTYAVTVSNFDNCVEQITFEIPPSEGGLNIESVNSLPACGGLSNGALELSVSGSENYTVLAVDGDDNEFDSVDALPAGTYEVFVIDENGCTAEAEVDIEEGDLQVEITAESIGDCGTGEVQLSVNATENASYSWSPTEGLDDPTSPNPIASPNDNTFYTVMIETPEGCSATQEISVDFTAGAAPQLSYVSTDDLELCEGETVNMLVSVPGGISYTWEPTEGVTGTNAVYLNPESTTTYTVTASLANGCTVAEEITITVEDCSQTVNIESINIVEAIYPNPSEGEFQVNTSDLVNQYAVYDISGKLVLQENVVNTQQFNIDLNGYSAGIYLLHIQSKEGIVIEKLLVQ